ncbi:DUF6896 domain-containing protein [Paraburkholderia graminis]|uniref:DUF6896 domain-containing protein n=1 Tax=Paraburkholderia graminis TaxID=60548 RepID=UPI00278F3125|nr:hypothetical protein [Paraburkholderia graminis]MDQ0627265.1 hypothetical protein [Paraburkholderia graminis]
MTNQHPLSGLIADYQKSVHAAVVLMQRSGIPMPFSSADWIEMNLSPYGELEGGIHYFKHGAGCKVDLASGTVDFDFGERGEIGGFDAWRLTEYAGGRLAQYGFDTKAVLDDCFAAAVTAGFLVGSGYNQYYVADLPRVYATDVDSRLPGDNLPPQSQDRVLALYAHCFLAADLMRKNCKNLDGKWEKRGRLSGNDNIDIKIYFASWLGYLRATCEGFDELRMRILLQENRPPEFRELLGKSDELGRLMKRHRESLRKLRNSVFHLPADVSAFRDFFDADGERLLWAHELHQAIGEFLSEYRILCQIHYLLHGRTGELAAQRKRSRRRKIAA